MSYPERIVPDETEPGVVALHLKRYQFASPFCEAADVLDAGCGVGYGSALLAGVARSVLGVDRDHGSVEYACSRYVARNLAFAVHDLLQLELEAASFDVVTSFEVIEHLTDQERFLAEIVRVLRPGGVFVVSTPRVELTNDRPENPFHERELSAEDFASLLGRHFDQVELYGQRRLQTGRHRTLQRLDVLGLRRRLPFLRRASSRLTGTPATTDLTAGDVSITPGELAGATEIVATARKL